MLISRRREKVEEEEEEEEELCDCDMAEQKLSPNEKPEPTGDPSSSSSFAVEHLRRRLSSCSFFLFS